VAPLSVAAGIPGALIIKQPGIVEWVRSSRLVPRASQCPGLRRRRARGVPEPFATPYTFHRSSLAEGTPTVSTAAA
jgi:hypothetical protein